MEINDANEAAQPEETVVVEIILTKSGEIKVKGMIQDKIVALGFLELAKNTLFKHWEASEIKIHKPGGMINFLRNGKR